MSQVWFRFYAQLNDFLPRGRRGRRFIQAISETSSIKDTVEALGVPHPEIDLVLVNGATALMLVAYALRIVSTGHVA